MADPKNLSGVGDAIGDAKQAFPDCAAGATEPCQAPAKAAKIRPCVKQVNATIGGTEGIRKGNPQPADVIVLPSGIPKRKDTVYKSGSSEKNFKKNKPVVLIRGCKDVMLEAITTPPAATAVVWKVEANHTPNAPPEIIPEGAKATLKTNIDGSFSVIATLGGCKVVWNVIFVWVQVDVASSQKPQPTAHYSGDIALFSFKSGKFPDDGCTTNNPKCEYAWADQLNVRLIGGGDDQKAGVEKVNLRVLQNGTKDELTGHYAPPPVGATAVEKPPGGLPALDATNEKSRPFLDDSSGTFKLLSGKKGDVDLTVWTGDSPGGKFDGKHKVTHTPLKSVSGGIHFDTAIASFSDDAQHSIVVHAHTTWSTDCSGDMDRHGNYTPRGAHTKPEALWSLISSAAGGQDAGEFGMETLGQLFGDNLFPDFDWQP